jgi:glycosyltransferase involved in cell wall biosynthesis
MKIGIDTTWMGNEPSGVGTFAGEVIRELEGREDLELVLFKAVDRSWRRHLDLYQEIADRKIDVLWQLGGWLPLFMPSGVKTIQTVHDLISYDHPEWFPQTGLSRFWSQNILVPNAIKKADLVHAVSNYTANQLDRFSSVKDRIVMAYQGAELPSKIDSTLIPDAIAGIPYLVMIGTVEPRKNISSAIEAFKIVGDKNQKAKLVILGAKGWGTSETIEAINSAGNAVIYLGYVSDDVKFSILKGARGLVMTSYEEGFGRPLVEAMRLDVPVAASYSSGMKEVAEDAGIMVLMDDIQKIAHAMERLLNHEELRGKLIALGRKRLEKFNTKKMVDRILDKLLKNNYKDTLSN